MEVNVIEISPSSREKKEEEEGTPLRPVFCLKKKVEMKHFEEIEDCFVLDFNPFESPIDIHKHTQNQNQELPLTDHDHGHDGLSIIAEKGQVACRDYPHSRHLCLKFPFDTTPHESYCELCYCYVCDSAAPCKLWTKYGQAHCHASEYLGDWESQRNSRKQQQQCAVKK